MNHPESSAHEETAEAELATVLDQHVQQILRISDELRGPLAIFSGYLTMARDGDVSFGEVLPILLSQAQKMNKMLTKLLLEARTPFAG